jgi:uncharacterized membrane protein
MADEKQGLIDRGLDMLDHQNDKRVVVFTLALGAVLALFWLAGRPNVPKELLENTLWVVAMVLGLAAVTVAGISLRPEKSQTVPVPMKVTTAEPSAPEPASASVETPKQP